MKHGLLRGVAGQDRYICHVIAGNGEPRVGEDLAAWAPNPGHLAGCAGTMRHSELNPSKHLGLSSELSDGLLKLNPPEFFRGVNGQDSTPCFGEPETIGSV